MPMKREHAGPGCGIVKGLPEGARSSVREPGYEYLVLIHVVLTLDRRQLVTKVCMSGYGKPIRMAIAVRDNENPTERLGVRFP